MRQKERTAKKPVCAGPARREEDKADKKARSAQGGEAKKGREGRWDVRDGLSVMPLWAWIRRAEGSRLKRRGSS